jgi:hypothetical protein
VAFTQAALDEDGHAQFYGSREFILRKDLFAQASENATISIVERAILIATP